MDYLSQKLNLYLQIRREMELNKAQMALRLGINRQAFDAFIMRENNIVGDIKHLLDAFEYQAGMYNNSCFFATSYGKITLGDLFQYCGITDLNDLSKRTGYSHDRIKQIKKRYNSGNQVASFLSEIKRVAKCLDVKLSEDCRFIESTT